MRLQTLRAGIPGLVLVAMVQMASAQVPGMIGRVDATEQQRSLEGTPFKDGDTAPEIYPGESTDVGPQSVLKIKQQKNFLEGTVDSQYLYSDNVFLQHDNRQSSGLLVSTAQFELAPTPYQLGEGTFAPRIGYRHQWYDFLQYEGHDPAFSREDFNAQTVFIDERWTCHDWIVGAGFDYTRLLTTSSYDQLYAEYVPRWELARVFTLSPKHALSLSYQGYYHFTDAPAAALPENSTADRVDEMFTVALNCTPCPHVIIQPFYTFKYTHFTAEVNRNDYLNSCGVAAYYFFNENLSARAFFGYDDKESSVTAAGYHQLGAGAGINFTLRF